GGGGGLEVARGLDGQIEPRVASEQVEHVVQEANAGLALAASSTVEREADVDVGLGGLTVYLGGAGHRTSHCLGCASPSSARGARSSRPAPRVPRRRRGRWDRRP